MQPNPIGVVHRDRLAISHIDARTPPRVTSVDSFLLLACERAASGQPRRQMGDSARVESKGAEEMATMTFDSASAASNSPSSADTLTTAGMSHPAASGVASS
jgi:hypothetical protein